MHLRGNHRWVPLQYPCNKGGFTSNIPDSLAYLQSKHQSRCLSCDIQRTQGNTTSQRQKTKINERKRQLLPKICTAYFV